MFILSPLYNIVLKIVIVIILGGTRSVRPL